MKFMCNEVYKNLQSLVFENPKGILEFKTLSAKKIIENLTLSEINELAKKIEKEIDLHNKQLLKYKLLGYGDEFFEACQKLNSAQVLNFYMSSLLKKRKEELTKLSINKKMRR